jgi:hypothetical protein
LHDRLRAVAATLAAVKDDSFDRLTCSEDPETMADLGQGLLGTGVVEYVVVMFDDSGDEGVVGRQDGWTWF